MSSQIAEPVIDISWSKVPIYLLIGVIVCIFSLNGLLKNVAGHWAESSAGPILTKLSEIPDAIYQILPGNQYFLTELFFRWLLISIVIFIFLLVVNALWQKSGAVFLSGIGGLAIGTFIFTWVSLILYLLAGIWWLISSIIYIVYSIVAWIAGILLWPPIMYGIIALVGLGFAVLVVKALIDYWDDIIAFFTSAETWKMFLKIGLVLGAIAGLGYLLVKIWQLYLRAIFEAIRDWIAYYILPAIIWIFSTIGSLIVILLAAGITLFVLLVLGYQYADQFFAARNCGRSTHRAFDAGFGFGVAVAVIFLVCSANPEYERLITTAWNTIMPLKTGGLIDVFHGLMPVGAENFLTGLFVKPALPIFDIASLLFGILFANCSLTMSLISGTVEEPFRDLVRKERLPMFLKLAAGAFIVVAVAIAGSLDGDSVSSLDGDSVGSFDGDIF